jgi:hypothetical protein
MPDEREMGRNPPPPPPRDYSMDGTRRAGEFRIRTGWFGFAVLEEKVEYRGGEVRWKRRPNWLGPVYIK